MIRKTGRIMAARRRRHEGGVTLFLALFCILFLSGYILVNMNVDADRMERQRATETAWLVQQLADAARLYVRDNSANPASPFARENLCAAPINVTAPDLTTNGYIRDVIGQLDATGLNYITPMGQTVRITAAISDLSAGCGSLTGVASSAYLVLEPGARTSRQGILYLVEALGNKGIPLSAPMFDDAGNNISPDCGGSPATLQWNTGCLTAGQYSLIHPSGAFTMNTLGLPAWLTFRGDNRALFRFPQPENPQAQQMATDLNLAPTGVSYGALNVRTVDDAAVSANPLATKDVASGVRQTDDDSGADVRRNLTNVGALNVGRIIVDPQAADVSDSGGVETGTDPDMNVSGTMTIGSASAPANVRSFAQAASFSAGTLDIGGASPSLAVQPRATGEAPTLRVVQDPANPSSTGNVAVKILQANTGEAQDVAVSGPASFTNELKVNTLATVQGANGVVANRLSGTVVGLSANNVVTSGATAVTNTAEIRGGGALSYATARVDAGRANLRGNMTVSGDVSTAGNADMSSINSVGTCYGDCPERQQVCPPLDPDC